MPSAITSLVIYEVCCLLVFPVILVCLASYQAFTTFFFFTSPHPAKATHMRGKDLITGDALTSPDYRFIRFAKRPSSVHKTSRSTKRSIPRSIMPSINTPRLSLLSILLTFNVFAVIPAAARTLVSRFRLHPPLSRSSPVPVPNHIRRRLRMVCFQAVRVFILGQLLNLGH